MRGNASWRFASVAAMLIFPLLVACGSKGPEADAPSTPGASEASTLAGRQAPDFSLVDQFDQRQQLSKFQGKVVLLTFASTHCTTVCPLTAEMLSRTQDLLGADAHSLQVVAVNTNFVFRSVQDVARWSKAHSMTNRWFFLTGSVHRLASVYSDYGVTPGNSHSIVVYLIDPEGRIQTAIPVAMEKGLDAEARAVARYVRQLEAA